MKNICLKEELLEMMRVDQVARFNPPWDPEMDRRHTERMKVIIEECGWPKYDVVGEEGANAAWLLVQHADQDVAFQRKCLGLLEQAVGEGQAHKMQLAYLTDRVLVNSGQQQFYGTQFYVNEKGEYGSRPIKDTEHLDERRKQMSLIPFKDYEANMRKKQEEWEKIKK